MGTRGRITRDSIDRLLEAIPLEELIGESVTLRRSGARSTGLCPFHAEKSPSFYVLGDHYHCFGCGAHGNAIDFEMARAAKTFPEAAETLASRFNIELNFESEISAEDEIKNRRKKELLSVLDELAAFYARCLHHKVGTEARSYLETVRGYEQQTIEDFALGYAPARNTLADLANKRGWDPALLKELGLLKASQRQYGPDFDLLRDRVIVPIRDQNGHVVGFGGRIMPRPSSSGPKYINSPESIAFQKSRILFNLERAKKSILATGEAIIVEGYMDAIALNQVGIHNVVAVLGTALTTGHVQLLSRYAKRLLFCFDTDEAGQKALRHAFEVAWPLNLLELRVLPLDDAKDPDEFVKAKGAEAFRLLTASSRPILESLFERATTGRTYLSERVAIIRQNLIPLIEQNPVRALRESTVADLGRLLGVSSSSLRSAPTHQNSSQNKVQKVIPTTPAIEPINENPKRIRVRSTAELRLAITLSRAEASDLPQNLVRLYCGITEDDFSADLITFRTLQSQLNPTSLAAVDHFVCEILAKAGRKPEHGVFLRIAPEIEEGVHWCKIINALLEQEPDVLEFYGIDARILQTRGAATDRFHSQFDVLDSRNAGYLGFALKDAQAAEKNGTIGSHVQKLLVDLEIAYLDGELAQLTGNALKAGAQRAQPEVDGLAQYRKIMQERAKRLLCR